MSLINDMLRDLETRRSATPTSTPVPALEGIAAVPAPDAGRHRRRAALGVGLVAVVAVAWFLYTARTPVHPPATAAPPPAASALAPAPPDPAPVANPVTNKAMATMRGGRPVTSEATPPTRTTVAVPTPATARPSGGSPVGAVGDAARAVSARSGAARAVAVPRHPPARVAPVVVRRIAPPPDPATRFYRRALARLRAGDSGAAEAALQRALALDPAQERARELLAALWMRAGRNAAAKALLGPYVAGHPGDFTLVRLYARVLVGEGDLRGARRTLEASLPEATDDPAFDALLAAVYQRLGEHRRAATAYRAALTLRPLDGTRWAGLGIALEGSGATREAQAAYRRAVDLGGLAPALARYVRERLAALR